MKPKTIVAILLIVLGIVAFAYQGITYTTRGAGMDIGPIHMASDQAGRIPLPPIFGAIALICGISMLLVDGRDFRRVGHALRDDR